MSKLQTLIEKHKLTVALVGGSLALGTAYGSCVLSPPGATEAAEEVAEVEGPAEVEAPAPEAVEGD